MRRRTEPVGPRALLGQAAPKPKPRRPRGSSWSPVQWIRLIIWKWQLGGATTTDERHGYWFWGPTIFLILGVELLAALSSSFKNWIPWPTISSTVGHLEKRWDWVAVIVVGLLSAVAFHANAQRAPILTAGRSLRAGGPKVRDTPWYNPLLVAALTVVAFAVPYALDVSKYELGYTIYGVLAVFGILIPSALSFGYNRLVWFPTLFFTIDRLRQRLHVVAVILVAGLAILAVHLAFYPWPDITHESATFAGLDPESARTKAERALRELRNGMPALAYSTQAKDVVDGEDAWSVYFRQRCVVVVTRAKITPSPECLK